MADFQRRGDPRSQQTGTTEIVRRPVEDLVPVGTYKDTAQLAEVLAKLQANVHLTTPVGSIGNIPRGYGIALSACSIDPDTDTYKPKGGKGGDGDDTRGGSAGDDLAIKGAALARICGMSGVTWVAEKSGRVDDGADPNYFRARAVGKIKDPDGQWREECREKEVDLRDGSATVRDMRRNSWKRAKATCAKFQKTFSEEAWEDDFERELDQVRVNLAALAESKAKNRVIRHLLAIKPTYKRGELAKPFVAMKLVFTMEFGDAETNREAARMVVAKELGYDAAGAAAMLYGNNRGLLGSPINTTGPRTSPAPEEGTTMPSDSVNDLADALDAEADEIPAGVAPPAGTTAGAAGLSPPAAPAGLVKEPELPLSGKAPAGSPAGARAPLAFDSMDDATQTEAIIMLAEQKGKLGSGEGQTGEGKFRALTRQSRAKWYDALLKLPDAPAEEEDTPEWAK